jgi:hypothetical protein
MIKIYNSPCSLPPPFPNHFQTPLFFSNHSQTPFHVLLPSSIHLTTLPPIPTPPLKTLSVTPQPVLAFLMILMVVTCKLIGLHHLPCYQRPTLQLPQKPTLWLRGISLHHPQCHQKPTLQLSQKSDLPFPPSIKARKQTGLLDFFSRMPAKEVHEKWGKRKRENEDRDREEHAKLKWKEEAEKLQKLEKRCTNKQSGFTGQAQGKTYKGKGQE